MNMNVLSSTILSHLLLTCPSSVKMSEYPSNWILTTITWKKRVFFVLLFSWPLGKCTFQILVRNRFRRITIKFVNISPKMWPSIAFYNFLWLGYCLTMSGKYQIITWKLRQNDFKKESDIITFRHANKLLTQPSYPKASTQVFKFVVLKICLARGN